MSATATRRDHFGFAFAVGVTLNTVFVVAELVFGYAANSLALISDAVHNFSDVIALLLAWGATWLAQQAADAAAHLWLPPRLDPGGAVQCRPAADRGRRHRGRSHQPARRSRPTVAGWTVVLVAALGILVNGATALLFMRGRHGDLNIRGAYLHMAADAGVSLRRGGRRAGDHGDGMAVGRSGDQPRASPRSCWRAAGALPRDSVNLALDGVPKGIELAEVKEYLDRLEGVTEVHDLHIWAMSTNETALTAHLVRPAGYRRRLSARRLRGAVAPLQYPSCHAADRGEQRCLQARAGRGGLSVQITPW